ncbi:hypothetical protein P9239_01860 [Caballeronia sp. LZ062]|nr:MULTISPECIES: hypothetical protein [unclassified Caballeronia]MDR5857555.1 hypothetical protein [Caballeronia sp. LZ050]MDR5869105.1 hypothetical protein [Caballeronia sp. LZ062]
MFDDTSFEQYSMLDDFALTAPVWRPFVQPASADAPKSAQDCGESITLS